MLKPSSTSSGSVTRSRYIPNVALDENDFPSHSVVSGKFGAPKEIQDQSHDLPSITVEDLRQLARLLPPELARLISEADVMVRYLSFFATTYSLSCRIIIQTFP